MSKTKKVKMSKLSTAEKFNKLLAQGLEILGEKIADSGFNTNQYKIETTGGELIVTLSTPQPCQSKSSTIGAYSRFKEPKKAHIVADCNIYSGKWNWCWFVSDNSIEMFVANVLDDIMDITVFSDRSKVFKCTEYIIEMQAVELANKIN